MQVTALFFGPDLGDDAFFRLEIVEHFGRIEGRFALLEDGPPLHFAQRIEGSVSAAGAGLEVEFKAGRRQDDVFVFGLGIAEIVDFLLGHVAVRRIGGRANHLRLDGRLRTGPDFLLQGNFQCVALHPRNRIVGRIEGIRLGKAKSVGLERRDKLRGIGKQNGIRGRNRVQHQSNRVDDAFLHRSNSVGFHWLKIVRILLNMSHLLAPEQHHEQHGHQRKCRCGNNFFMYCAFYQVENNYFCANKSRCKDSFSSRINNK